jgi:hypothetical protein
LKHQIRTLLNIIFGFALSFTSISQSCFPDGITFETQAQIDSFQINYPNCTEIDGTVIIGDNYSGDITNLSGLNSITYIEGDLRIVGNGALTNLTGLENLASIQQNLYIGYWGAGNPALTHLTGLDNLEYIGYDLQICLNDNLIQLTGLGSLTNLNHDLLIQGNNSLISLTGLEGLTHIGGSLEISVNNSLLDLTGLNSLSTVDYSVWIGNPMNGGNNALVNLNGLNSLSKVWSLNIYYNALLTSLGGIETIDSIRHLGIVGNWSLIDISSLATLHNIQGDVNIVANTALQNLDGLNNIVKIGDDLEISQNTYLQNLDGLESLHDIGGNLYIGKNHYMENLNGLLSLASIGGGLSIENQSFITSLSGLDNIDSGSISNLYVVGNNLLSTCDVKSVCDYLARPDAIVEIQNNNIGCDSREEVEAICLIGIDESITSKNFFNICPNPASTVITIEIKEFSQQIDLTIMNLNGKELDHYHIMEHRTVIDIRHLNIGVYIVRFTSKNEVGMYKVVKY